MMRNFLILSAFVFSGCASNVEPRVIAATPASVEIECMSAWTGCSSAPQAIADMAQAHCQRFKLNARQSIVARSPSGNEVSTYACVP